MNYPSLGNEERGGEDADSQERGRSVGVLARLHT